MLAYFFCLLSSVEIIINTLKRRMPLKIIFFVLIGIHIDIQISICKTVFFYFSRLTFKFLDFTFIYD